MNLTQELIVKNFAIKPHFIMSYIPIGEYQLKFSLFNDNDDFIAEADVTASVGL